jgi:hypothetical protein
MTKWMDRASCKRENERREDAIECSGSTMQGPYEDVLAVASLAGSLQLQRWKVETQMVAGTNSVRDRESRTAGGSSMGRQRRRVGMPAVSGCLVLCARCTDLANEDWLHASQ